MSTLQKKFEVSLTSQKEELMAFLQMRLKETDWKRNITNICRDLIQERGLDQVNIEEIVKELIPRAEQAIPESIQNELLEKIKKTLD